MIFGIDTKHTSIFNKKDNYCKIDVIALFYCRCLIVALLHLPIKVRSPGIKQRKKQLPLNTSL